MSVKGGHVAEPVEIEAKALINASKTPSVDYVMNPYVGCVSWSRRHAAIVRRIADDRPCVALKVGQHLNRLTTTPRMT